MSKRPDYWWTDPDCDFAKVSYLTLDNYVTQAYVDLRTLTGDNRHTDEPVKLERVDKPLRGESGLDREVYYREIE